MKPAFTSSSLAERVTVQLCQALQSAVRNGHKACISALLSGGGEPNFSSLHYAIRVKDRDIARILLPYFSALERSQVLSYAVKVQASKIAKDIIEIGIDLDESDQTQHGQMPSQLQLGPISLKSCIFSLNAAFSNRSQDVLEILLQHTTTIDISEKILAGCVRARSPEVLHTILTADVEWKDTGILALSNCLQFLCRLADA